MRYGTTYCFLITHNERISYKVQRTFFLVAQIICVAQTHSRLDALSHVNYVEQIDIQQRARSFVGSRCQFTITSLCSAAVKKKKKRQETKIPRMISASTARSQVAFITRLSKSV